MPECEVFLRVFVADCCFTNPEDTLLFVEQHSDRTKPNGLLAWSASTRSVASPRVRLEIVQLRLLRRGQYLQELASGSRSGH